MTNIYHVLDQHPEADGYLLDHLGDIAARLLGAARRRDEALHVRDVAAQDVREAEAVSNRLMGLNAFADDPDEPWEEPVEATKPEPARPEPKAETKSGTGPTSDEMKRRWIVTRRNWAKEEAVPALEAALKRGRVSREWDRIVAMIRTAANPSSALNEADTAMKMATKAVRSKFPADVPPEIAAVVAAWRIRT